MKSHNDLLPKVYLGFKKNSHVASIEIIIKKTGSYTSAIVVLYSGRNTCYVWLLLIFLPTFYIVIYNYQAVTTAAAEANTTSCTRSHSVVFLGPLLAAVEIISCQWNKKHTFIYLFFLKDILPVFCFVVFFGGRGLFYWQFGFILQTFKIAFWGDTWNTTSSFANQGTVYKMSGSPRLTGRP